VKRLWTLFHFPYRSGRSLQRAPDRSTHKTAFTNSRLSAAVRPQVSGGVQVAKFRKNGLCGLGGTFVSRRATRVVKESSGSVLRPRPPRLPPLIHVPQELVRRLRVQRYAWYRYPKNAAMAQRDERSGEAGSNRPIGLDPRC
jgi:hypothetical protein